MATDKKEVNPVLKKAVVLKKDDLKADAVKKDASKKDVAKKDKPKSVSSKKTRRFNPKKTAVAIGHFFRDVWFELKKVTWPTRKEFLSYSVAVLVFVAIFGVIIFAMDLVLGVGLKFLVA